MADFLACFGTTLGTKLIYLVLTLTEEEEECSSVVARCCYRCCSMLLQGT